MSVFLLAYYCYFQAIVLSSSRQNPIISNHKTFIHYVDILTFRSMVTVYGYKVCSLPHQVSGV